MTPLLRNLAAAVIVAASLAGGARAADAPQFWPPVIWSGTCYLDARQFAVLAPCSFAWKGADLQLSASGQDLLLEDCGRCGERDFRRGAFTYGAGLDFVPARALTAFDHRVGWDDASHQLVIDGETRLDVLEPPEFFAIVPLPRWYPSLPGQRGGNPDLGAYAAPVAYPTLSPAVWPVRSGSSGGVVYVTKTGEKYHRAGCQYLRKSQRAISRAAAVAEGYTPCSRCNP